MQTFSTQLKSVVERSLQVFRSRIRSTGRSLQMEIETVEDDFNLQISFVGQKEKAALVIPKLRENEFGNLVIGERNDRVVCPFILVDPVDGKTRHASYVNMLEFLLSERTDHLFPEQGQRNALDKIMWGFYQGRGQLSVSMVQRFLNQRFFHMLPLSGTPMQDFAMNQRVMIFDSKFEGFSNPSEKLEYQKRKNFVLFPWTSIGISDGAAATKNYILKEDLRKYTCFGKRHHNPIRNLYSTLGMKGDEKAWVVSRSALDLEERGIYRSGWNLMTAFLDLPAVFEDQILVSKRLADKAVFYERSITVFGTPLVEVGQKVQKGQKLSIEPNEKFELFSIDCDSAEVLEIKDSFIPFDGGSHPVKTVVFKLGFFLKEGIKITNQHGNKGVVVLEDLGSVKDPVRGEIPIDVIVSARSVGKRKNFGQILEALVTLTHGPDKRVVVSDDMEVSVPRVVEKLTASGYSEDGTCQISTHWGEFKAVCGWVHWGVTKTPEEQLWQGSDTWTENGKGLRTRGTKVSTIELKALTTLLGPGSKVVKEILSYQQGTDEVMEMLRVVETLRGRYNEETTVAPINAIRPIPSGSGTFHNPLELAGTVADESMYPKGVYLKFPADLKVEIFVPNHPNEEPQVRIGSEETQEERSTEGKAYITDRVYLPAFSLRQPWKHATGLLGMSEMATLSNQVLEAGSRLTLGEIKKEEFCAQIVRYIETVSSRLSTKSGLVSQLLMAVRYPWSSKATATLKEGLPENTVEIHRSMAKDLKVRHGDFVLVERFPCLGFMSVRIQRVSVTDDPQCKYVVRVSGNSLVSMNLDFDGDVVYVWSFQTEAAKRELEQNYHFPHPRVKEVIDRLNGRKVPMTREMSLMDYELHAFRPMSAEEHANLVERSLAVKAYTGPVIALCYNLMRIVEANIPYKAREAHIVVEEFLDKVGNSVFSQKHGIRSLRDECVDAICTADAEALVKLGFPHQESQVLCRIILKCAKEVGLSNREKLVEFHEGKVKGGGQSNLISRIIRRLHKNYFATRAKLHPIRMLEHLEAEPVDLVGYLIKNSLSRESSKKE